MLRKPVPLSNQTYDSQQLRSIDQPQSVDFSNNPTRRGAFNSNQNYLVNETKVKRPVVSENASYTGGTASYKLQRHSPYASGQIDGLPENVNQNKSKIQPQNNKENQDDARSIKPEHLVSFGNITNRNPSSRSSKKQNPHNPTQQFIDKQNYEPNSEDSRSYQIPINLSHLNKNKITKNQINPSLKDHLMLKRQQQNEMLLPIVNTNTGNRSSHSNQSVINNFHSNALSQTSSIPSQSDSRISQSDESSYLKQKLIETHSKLLKQLEISKQLEDNFFSLKTKYEEAVSLLNQYKSKEFSQMSQSKIKQFQQRQAQWNAQSIMLTQRVQELTQEKESLQNQLTQMSQNMSELILQNQSQKKTKNQTLKYSSNDMKQCIYQQKAQYNQQLSQYNHEKAQYQEELGKQSNKIQELKNDLENMRNKVLEMIKEKEGREQEIESFTDERQFLQNQLKVLEQKLSKKDKEFTEKEELCEIWRKKYSDAQEQYEKVYESSIKLEKQAKELKNMNQQLNIALRQQKQKNAQMLSEIINIQMETKQLKSKVSTLEEQRKNLQDKLFENSQHKNITQQKLQLQHNIQKLTHQYNSLSAIINKKDKQINDLTSQVLEKNNLVHKMVIREKELEIKQRDIEKKERDVQDQKMSRMTSVKDFVNRLEQDKDRNVGMRRASCNNGVKMNGQTGQLSNNMQNQVNYQAHNFQAPIRQNVLNVSGLMRNESGSTTPKRELSPLSNNNNRTPNHMGRDIQSIGNEDLTNQQMASNQQRSLTPSKSLSGLKVNRIETNKFNANNKQQMNEYKNNNNKILICDNDNEQEYVYQQDDECMPSSYGYEQDKNFNCQENCGYNQGQYESVEDSLQLIRMINKISQPNSNQQKNLSKNDQSQSVNSYNPICYEPSANYCNDSDKGLTASKSAQQLHSSKPTPNLQTKQFQGSASQSKPNPASRNQTQEKQKQISSYKQQKQQYLSLLQQIGQLQTQNYNLNQEKKKIVDELQKIQSTKTKTKQIIARRRQLELWLLGNQKKNNEVKEKLKLYRGKVL